MASVPQKSLERYELIERIAVGGMAEVYRAVAFGAHGFEKTLAIKRILPELAKDREFEERFIAEAKLAVSLTHANIVQVFDFGRFAGSPFIAMEFVDGLDLAAMLKRYKERNERIPLQAAFHIAVEIVRGLDFAHQHGVVHRDVSPSNILLSKAGEVKIADFGIAVAASRVRVERPAGRRKIMGKWRYMSPEQTQGDDVSTSSDLFSAASVMFELFTGDKLFPGDEVEDIVENIFSMEIPLASQRRQGLPPRLDEILLAALARDPGRRPRRAAELQRALTEISYESSIVATALDVAEAVDRVLVPRERAPEPAESGLDPMSLDQLIRQQLSADAGPRESTEASEPPEGSAPEVGRPVVDATPATDAPPRRSQASEDAPVEDSGLRKTQTATIVRAGVDADGVTVWELGAESTIAAVPSAKRHGRRTGSARALAGEPAPVADEGASRRFASMLIAGALVALGVILGVVLLAGKGSGTPATPARPVALAPIDAAAAPQPRVAFIYIDSTPPGAFISIDGTRIADVTPHQVEVSADEPHAVRIEKPGFHPHVDDAVVTPAGQTSRVIARLRTSRATLAVASEPAGASVRLDGEVLGVTPLEIDDLAPGAARDLSIAHPGYRTVTMPIELVAGERLTIQRTLEKTVAPSGRVLIFVESGWAEIYFRGRRIGRATTREPLSLPVGRHRLRLFNPVSKQETTLEVEVREGAVSKYRATL